MNNQDNKNLAHRMDGFERELQKLNNTMLAGFASITKEISSLKQDSEFLTEGSTKHGIPAIRKEVAQVKSLARQANRRIDHILWLVAGISLGSGIGGSLILKLLLGI